MCTWHIHAARKSLTPSLREDFCISTCDAAHLQRCCSGSFVSDSLAERVMLNQLPRRDIIMTGGMMVREERDTPSAISSRQLTLASAALKSSDCRLHLLVCWISRLLFYCRCMALAVRPRDHTTGISPPTDHSYFATRLLCAAARWFGRRTDDVLRRCV